MADRYIDFTKSTGTLTGTWTFTITSTSVTAASDGDAVNQLANGDYIRVSNGTQWYKVTARPNADTITILPAFQQGTVTDTVNTSLYNSETGAGTATAFAHLNQATTDEVRVAGDIIRMRANQTHVYSGRDISFDEGGSVNNRITLKGADSVDDPWSDASDVRPIIDFASSVNSNLVLNEVFWIVDHLDFIGGASTSGAMSILSSAHVRLTDCRFYNNGTGATHAALWASGCPHLEIIDCTFDNNFGKSLDVSSLGLYLENCVFDGDTVGGGNGTDYGIEITSGRVYMRDCTFGVTDDHDLGDIFVARDALVYGRNVKLDSVTEVAIRDVEDPPFIRLEDDEQTHLAFRAWLFSGNLSRTTVVNRSGDGGTDWSILGEPNSNCGADEPLYIIGDRLRGIPLYLDGTAQTITIYAYATSWTGLPSVTQFVVEIDHIQGVGDWDTDVTADTFAANDAWESFDVTLTPFAAGFAYLRVKLLDYEDGTEKIYIDPVPEIDSSRDESQIAATVDGVMAGYEIVAAGGGGRQTRGRFHNV